MKLIICPGIHPTQLTDSFIDRLQLNCDRQISDNLLVFHTENYPAYSAIDIERWLKQHQLSPKSSPSLFFITFSAGTVGGIGAAFLWQLQGGQIKAFVAIDGWGVPLVASFPIYRLSHDYFTHWSSALLGKGKEGFYADPSVKHLELWHSPHCCWGWRTLGYGLKTRCSAAKYLQFLLQREFTNSKCHQNLRIF